MVDVKHRVYKEWSGCLIHGTAPVPVSTSDLHLERAYYLLSQLEAPKYGTVQSYDGAGISGGPLHSIAVLPKTMGQGELWKLLRWLIRTTPEAQGLKQLVAALAAQGWRVADDGTLRTGTTLVSGADIRDEIAPPNGKVPKAGPDWEQAKRWAILFHTALSDPATFDGQKAYAIEYLVRTKKATEAQFYGARPLETLRVASTTNPDPVNDISLIEDLAMCVYHAHSVNAPGPAAECLTDTLKVAPRGDRFARRLIWTLGKKAFGHWQDNTEGNSRYDRTQQAAKRCGLWPSEFFTGPSACMPKDLGGTAP
jgi:hypothetical protein